jgi:hypothetical protein
MVIATSLKDGLPTLLPLPASQPIDRSAWPDQEVALAANLVLEN